MEESAVRMKAYATSFSEIHVYLSKNYYNGISPCFYIQDEITGELVTLTSDSSPDSQNSEFQEYIFHTSFQMGKVYKIMDAYGLTCTLDYTRLSMCHEFDELYAYDGNDLGYTYTKEKTIFKVWAPLATGVILSMTINHEEKLYPMVREAKGVYTCTVFEDTELAEYCYLIRHKDTYEISLDPYAYSSLANGRKSVVVDIQKINKEESHLPPLENYTDAIIYETSVRDFSMSSSSGMQHKGQFLAFTESNTKTDSGIATGIDYLKELGITHLQLMPINDFATVDERNPLKLYNWGYDPAQYNVSEGSYVTNPDDGYKRIQEVVDMVNALHQKGIRVVLDVVYNHMHDVNQNALEKTVPHYFFRKNDDGSLSNGSWCGNDLNTTAVMCRRYILEMCKRWQVIYGIDGYRFDLMGIIDIDTMKFIEAQGKSIDPSFIVYGEGWNMGTALPEDKRTTIQNHQQVPHIGFFSDFFRDTIKGTNQMENKGYFLGDMYKINDALKAISDLDMFTSPNQSIHFVECHDNATCFDKIQISNQDESLDIQKKRLRLLLASVILSQGVPFIHSGQEFFRSKGGLENTYNAGDQINAIDWNQRDLEIETVEFVKFLIRLRKANPCFRYADYDMIRQNVLMENIGNKMIQYTLHQESGEYKDFCIYFNASLEEMNVNVDEGYQLLYHSEKKTIEENHICVSGVSLVILAR